MNGGVATVTESLRIFHRSPLFPMFGIMAVEALSYSHIVSASYSRTTWEHLVFLHDIIIRSRLAHPSMSTVLARWYIVVCQALFILLVVWRVKHPWVDMVARFLFPTSPYTGLDMAWASHIHARALVHPRGRARRSFPWGSDIRAFPFRCRAIQRLQKRGRANWTCPLALGNKEPMPSWWAGTGPLLLPLTRLGWLSCPWLDLA